MPNPTGDRLAALRRVMEEKNITAYIVPSEDEHSSEYLSPWDEMRPWISGFTGSAGTAIIELTSARVFTDGRYYTQARNEMDDNWTLMKLGLPDTPTHLQYLASLPSETTRVGVASKLVPVKDFEELEKGGLKIEGLEKDLVDVVRAELEGGQGGRAVGEIVVLGKEYAGQTVSAKLESLRASLDRSGHQGMIVTSLDEIAWTVNLRGADIAFNPVFFSYLLVTPDAALLFLPDGHSANLSPDVRHHLVAESIKVESYERVWEKLEEVRFSLSKSGGKKILGGLKTSHKVAQCLGVDNLDVQKSPITDAKSVKNETELEGFRQSHIRDGAALVKYFAWLEDFLQGGGVVNEYDAALKLEEFRKQNEHFQGLSFETISSTGANAAIIHYAPPATLSLTIDKAQIYLCDSGAQYTDGTTDVTRTLHFGSPSADEIRAFTRVLQGHIALATAIFPAGTTGYLLDAYARRPLWEDGLDYRHGTGHGVGHFLNVHEGPAGIGTRKAYDEYPVKEGMVLSNEPGYYEDGKFGIRIESLVLVKKADTRKNFGGKGYLTFENITMCPIQLSLIDVSLLSPSEKKWINSYHQECLEKLSPLVEGQALAWLERSCVPLA